MSTHSFTAAIMQGTRLEAAVLIGFVIPQIFSISMSSSPSDCLPSVETCMSNLCRSEQAFYGSICGDEGCQIKGLQVCNMTIQTAMDQFPSLEGCVCDWGEELCDSIQELATQCHQKPVYDGAGSCLDKMTVCVSDTVCNRYLAPVLQVCMGEQCDRDRCQQVTQQFYGSMPHNVAEMLVMCECEASDQSCVQMKAALHSGTCGDEMWICQDTVNQCVEDSSCRDLLKTFQHKCWSPEDTQCSNSDLQKDECFTQMDRGLILGADSECKLAFLATLGTALHYPCTCEGVHNEELQSCNMIHDVLHNRSHFMTSWESTNSPSKPPQINSSEQSHTWSHALSLTGEPFFSKVTMQLAPVLLQSSSMNYLLYAFTTVLFVGVVLLMLLAVVSKIRMLRKKDEAKFHHPQKANCVLIL